MYHRYLRNEQGEYRRQTVPDPPRRSPMPPPPPAPKEEPPAPPPRLADDSVSSRRREEADRAPAPEYQLPILNKLFPDMDQGDLLLLLIMLLLLSEGNEDASGMIMTLAIFLFLQ